ncbi:MAG: hypothetical protein FJW88_08500 [Actinobacteria bacterium]|nr:hypothetical protein [Actinomycetota bacterium]
MGVTGMANLAVKVPDVGAAARWYADHGFEVRGPRVWRDAEMAEVSLGPVQLTLFSRALYEEQADLADEAFLHAALFVDDLEEQVAGHEVVWGPEVVTGPFGTRRIVFVNAPGAIRLEFKEQLAPPADER